jgi:hypothetical protein
MSTTTQRETGTGQRHWSAIGEETFVGGMWLMYALFRVGGRLPFRAVLYPVVFWYWAVNRGAREASLEYLQRLQQSTGALGRAPGWRDTLRHFTSFAETILDKMLPPAATTGSTACASPAAARSRRWCAPGRARCSSPPTWAASRCARPRPTPRPA